MKIVSIKKGTAPLFALCGALCLSMPAGPRAELEVQPKQVGAYLDFGQILKGEMKDEKVEDQPITRTGVYLTVTGIYHKKLEVRLTTGGLFWYPLPELSTPSRRVRFGPGVGRAQGIYSFGDPEAPSGKLYFGLAPHKYNADAMNLGEYLYRSGTYPGYLWTGGWSYLNAASYMSQGVRLNLPTFGGKVTHDITLFMERDIAPTHNITPGYEFAVKPLTFLEIGGGAVWSHAIPLKKESKIRPKSRVNAYNKQTGLPLDLFDWTKPGYSIGDTMIVPDVTDPRWGTADYRGLNYVTPSENGTPNDLLGYYTFRGIKLMGRASLDFGAMLGGTIAPGSFKIYSEIALLGVENQPFYYENRDERMPKMVGISLPTFGLFDKLAVEAEHYKNRFGNQVGLLYDAGLPLPLKVGGNDDPFSYSDSAVAANPKKFSRDDWKWSVYARRKFGKAVTLFAQAANDHMRHFDTETKPANTPITKYPSDWYYVARVEFGLF